LRISNFKLPKFSNESGISNLKSEIRD